MSTKTLRKRIALVAVMALSAGVLASAPSQATAGTDLVTVSSALVKGTAAVENTATQSVGNQVIATWQGSAASNTAKYYLTSDAGGTIISASEATTGAWDKTNGTNYANGAELVIDEELLTTFAVTSSTPGTQVVKIQTLAAGTGVYTTVSKLTITWVAASSTAGVSAANSTIYPIKSAGTCSFGASKAGDAAAASANANTITSIATGTAIKLCVSPRNSSGDEIAITTSSSVISSLGSSAALAAQGQQTEASFTGATSPASGKATITAILIDNLGYTATITTEVTYYSTLKTLSIKPLVSAAYAADDQTTLGGTYTYAQYNTDAASTLNSLIIGLTAKDANGGVIDLAANANTTSTANWTVDSDKVPGAPADRASDSLGATVAAINVAGEDSSSKWGSNAAYINCSTKPEKLTITAWGKDVDANWVKSNSVDVYCSGSVAKVAVTASSAGVNVNVTDTNGYPVADGTSVTLAASNGSVVAPSTKSTTAGTFSTPATFIASSSAASSVVTAIVGSKSGTSAAIKGTGTDNSAAQIASLITKINALSKLIAKIQKKLGIK